VTATASFRAIGTTATIAVADAPALAPARALLERELAEIDAACSRFRADSELARLNRASGRRVRVGARLADALAVALQAAEASGGLVDPTVGASMRTLGYDRTFLLVLRRDGDRLDARVSTVPGWRRVELDLERRTVRVPAGTELDLGATAKALAADRAAHAAAAAVGCGVLVALGGDVAVAGEAPPDGWPVGVGDDHAGPAQATVAVRSGGVASSSTSVRRWRAGEIELHHVLDPRTGAPAATPWRTATVAAASCVDANVASTAAIVAGADAPRWLEERRLPARLVSVGGTCTCVGGWPEQDA
jgi:thiamine biosynthesis lipoprotein ApbE